MGHFYTEWRQMRSKHATRVIFLGVVYPGCKGFALTNFPGPSLPRTSPGSTGEEPTVRGLMLFGSAVIPVAVRAPLFVEAPPAGITPEYGEHVDAYGECRAYHGPIATGRDGCSLIRFPIRVRSCPCGPWSSSLIRGRRRLSTRSSAISPLLQGKLGGGADVWAPRCGSSPSDPASWLPSRPCRPRIP